MKFITEMLLRERHKNGAADSILLQDGECLTPAAGDYVKERGIQVISMAKEAPKLGENGQILNVPVGVSNRHAHLTQQHVEKLFGKGYTLTPWKALSQPGQFAAQEQVTLQGDKGSIHNVRILGPARALTQVEVARSDGFRLGVHPPIRLSGDVDSTPGITLIGPCGSLVIDKGLIVALNHVHMAPEDAQRFAVRNGDRLMLQTFGARKLIFADVVVRVHDDYRLDFHLDQDEANAAALKTGDILLWYGN